MVEIIDLHRDNQLVRAASNDQANGVDSSSSDELGDGGPRQSQFVKIMQGLKEALINKQLSKKNFQMLEHESVRHMK